MYHFSTLWTFSLKICSPAPSETQSKMISPKGVAMGLPWWSGIVGNVGLIPDQGTKTPYTTGSQNPMCPCAALREKPTCRH